MKNIYKGMNEDQLDDFNKQYDDYRQKSNFQKNYQLLGRMNNNRDNRRMIGNGQRRGGHPQIGGLLPQNEGNSNQNIQSHIYRSQKGSH